MDVVHANTFGAIHEVPDKNAHFDGKVSITLLKTRILTGLTLVENDRAAK